MKFPLMVKLNGNVFDHTYVSVNDINLVFVVILLDFNIFESLFLSRRNLV